MATSGHPQVIKQSLVATLLTRRPWSIAASSTGLLAVVAVGAEFLTPQPLVRSAGAAGTVAVVGGIVTAIYWRYAARSIGLCIGVVTGLATIGALLYGPIVVDIAGVYGTLALVSATVIVPSWSLLGVLGGLTGRVEPDDDRLRYSTRVPFHSDTEVDYEDVEVVIRSRDLGDRVAGTASYELVRSGEPNVSIPSVSDPEAFERTLNAEVTDPYRQREQAHRFQNRFWYLWPEYTETPPDPVVDEGDLADRLGVDVDDLALEKIKTAAEGEAVDDLSEVDTDFDGGDSGGTGGDADADDRGGFDGGGGDYDGAGGMNYHDF